MPIPLVGGWIAAFTAGFSRMMSSRAGFWFIGLVAFLGLELATREALIGPALDYLRTQASGTGAGDALAWLGYLNVDKYASILFSAYSVAGLQGVFLRRIPA